MAKYSPPDWSSSGRNAFGIYLEVIKGGVVVETLSLPRTDDRSYVVVGRMETVCDLALAHPSISRVHAALQFDEQGALFLYDLHSTHGCFVNKKHVLSEEFVRLHIGDVLVFGESTRLYAVCGPPELLPAEYESLNLAKFREKLDKKREILGKKKQEEDRGASWGFGEDAEEEESDEEDQANPAKEDLPDYLRNLKEDNEPYTSSVSQTQVNERDQRLYQQLQTRIRKMENLKLEKSRILAKQNQLDGLSEGQQRTLERNEQRIDALMKVIEDLEGRIHAKNDQRTKTSGNTGPARKKRNINEELYGYSSDEDDFYDRTKANQQKIAARKKTITGASDTPEATVASSARPPRSEVLTAESIQENVKKLEDELAKLEKELAAEAARAPTTGGETKKEEEVDSLDYFMAATTTQLHVSEVDALTRRKAEIESELKRQGHLLAVATPALAALPVQKPAETPLKNSSSMSSVEKKSLVQAQTQAPSVPEPEKPKTEVLPKNQGSVSQSKAASAETKPPNTPEARPVAKKTQKAIKNPNSSKRRRVSGPAMGPPQPTSCQQEDSSVLEGGDQVWVPPTNQTGDGRTKLNDKYGY
ncbi:hypothetical protein V7S43_012752 [Phytophthora oleae]|uniref:FHA domain-containing protein n=1 Tax=Phytophthora oleae TaxID=2107226 RepID=A0ABD3F9Q1_9STRA